MANTANPGSRRPTVVEIVNCPLCEVLNIACRRSHHMLSVHSELVGCTREVERRSLDRFQRHALLGAGGYGQHSGEGTGLAEETASLLCELPNCAACLIFSWGDFEILLTYVRNPMAWVAWNVS